MRREMADSNDDSNSSSQRQIATTGDDLQRSHDGASSWRTPRLKRKVGGSTRPDHQLISNLWACDQAKRLLPLDLLSAPGDRCCPFTPSFAVRWGTRDARHMILSITLWPLRDAGPACYRW